MTASITLDEITYTYVTTYARGGSLWEVTDERTGESARFQLDRSIDTAEALREHVEPARDLHASGVRARLRTIADRRAEARRAETEYLRHAVPTWRSMGWTLD